MAKVVPIEDELIVEARISPIDVGHVKIGDEAKVKITTYDFARFGAIEGVVEKISPTTFKEQDGTVYYKTSIRLDKNHVGDTAGENLILPGMVAEVDILAGERTVLRYLLRPIYQSLDTAMTER
jgi:HlyD family secretion protein/adhesin transport system membrane fusion protein